MISAFLQDALGQHAEVAADGNAGGGDGADFFGLADASFKFYCIGSCCDELSRCVESLGGSVVGVDGEIRDDESLWFCPGYCFQVVKNVREGDVCGIRVAEDDHAEGVSDEEDVEPGFIKQAGHGIVVAGECGYGTGSFLPGDDGDFF